MNNKIAFKNVIKSLKDYMVYFVTLTFAVAIFYVFNSLDSQISLFDESNRMILQTTASVINKISFGVIFILAMLMVYANSFIIKKRQKEFGLYLLFGMKRSKVGKIMLLETFYIGIVSIAFGLILGILLSQGLSLISNYAFNMNVATNFFAFSFVGFLKTIVVFFSLFIIIGMLNIIVIQRYKVLDLLNADKKIVSVKTGNKVVEIILFLVGIFLIGFSYYLITKVPEFGASFEKEIIGAGVLVTIGMFFFIRSFGVIFNSFKIKKYNVSMIQRNMIKTKIPQIYKSITVITLTLSMFLVVATALINFSIVTKNELDNGYPYDVSITSYPSNEVNLENIINLEKYANIENKINSKEITINEEQKYVFYKFFKQSDISDENIKGITINDDEVIVFNDDIKSLNEDKILMDTHELKIKKSINIENLYNSQEKMKLYIVNDAVFDAIDGLEDKKVNLSFKSLDLRNELYAALANLSSEDDEHSKAGFYFFEENMFRVDDKQSYIEQELEFKTILIFVLTFLACILILSTCVVISLQQLRDIINDKKSYLTLNQLGFEKKQINRIILKNNLFFFLIPVIISLSNCFVGIIFIKNFFSGMGKEFDPTIFFVVFGIIMIFYLTYMLITNYLSKTYIDDIFVK